MGLFDKLLILHYIFFGSRIHECFSFYTTSKAYYRKKKSSSSSALGYFDDISRYNNNYLGDIDELFLSDEERMKKRLEKKASTLKMELMKKHILGHDAQSAMQFNRKEVKKLTRRWMKKSGAVGKQRRTLEDGILYDDLVGMKVCSETTILGCIAFYWRSIVQDIIHVNVNDNNERNVYMIIFPYCQDLYQYDKHVLLNRIMELGDDLCQYVGPELSVTMFHPNYKNSPKIFSPERHSPFPTSGLKFEPKKQQHHEETILREQKEEDEEDNSIILKNPQQQRLDLERLFNSAAANKMENTKKESSTTAPTTTSNNNAPLFFLQKESIVKKTQDWFLLPENNMNKWFVLENNIHWYVSSATYAEEAYADIWGLIYELYHNDTKDPSTTKEAIFIVPSFCTYNASKFRQFAITVNAVLKRLTYGKIKLELFHPEYYDTNTMESSTRKTPYPTIQIICK